MPDHPPIQILLVEDHVLLRGVLAKVLSAERDFVIVGECGGVEDALHTVSSTPVDIVLLDINLGTEQGGAFLRRAGATGYQGKVLVVTAGVSEREAAWLLHRGCSGIFRKDEPFSSLVGRIREVMSGDAPFDRASVKAIVAQLLSEEREPAKALTPREGRVLRGVCEGLANKEIAQQLDVSEDSVKAFLRQLFAKTGARSRAQLVALAIERYWDQL